MATISAAVPCTPAVRGRHATIESTSLVAGHRFPRDIILLAVRYYLQLGAAAERIAGILADRGIDVSARTILRWVQKFGPALAASACWQRPTYARSGRAVCRQFEFRLVRRTVVGDRAPRRDPSRLRAHWTRSADSRNDRLSAP